MADPSGKLDGILWTFSARGAVAECAAEMSQNSGRREGLEKGADSQRHTGPGRPVSQVGHDHRDSVRRTLIPLTLLHSVVDFPTEGKSVGPAVWSVAGWTLTQAEPRSGVISSNERKPPLLPKTSAPQLAYCPRLQKAAFLPFTRLRALVSEEELVPTSAAWGATKPPTVRTRHRHPAHRANQGRTCSFLFLCSHHLPTVPRSCSHGAAAGLGLSRAPVTGSSVCSVPGCSRRGAQAWRAVAVSGEESQCIWLCSFRSCLVFWGSEAARSQPLFSKLFTLSSALRKVGGADLAISSTGIIPQPALSSWFFFSSVISDVCGEWFGDVAIRPMPLSTFWKEGLPTNSKTRRKNAEKL